MLFLKKCFLLATAFLTVLSITSKGYATEYAFYISDMPAVPTISDAGQLTEAFMTYDSETKFWRLRSTFVPDPITGALPSGYMTVISGGPMPMKAGEAATLYFDWTNTTKPIVTAYGYGANRPKNSHRDGSTAAGIQTPDRIVSSISNPNFIINFEVISAGTTLIIDFELDLTPVLNHTPLYQDAGNGGWFTPPIGAYIGLWHYPISAATFSYFTEGPGAGFVENLDFKLVGNYDITYLPLYSRPECYSPNQTGLAIAPEEFEVRVGQPFSGSVLGVDVGYNNQIENLVVTYSGLPTGATTTPADNTSNTPPVLATINWTPTAADQGQTFNMEVTFTDPAKLAATCPLKVRVPVNQPPVCDVSLTPSAVSCGGTTTKFIANGTLSNDPEGDPLSAEWTIICKDQAATNTLISQLQTEVTLTAPGLGQATSCTARLRVSDGVESTNCSARVNIAPCQLDCLGVPNGQAQLDQCGVCNGTNACLDCNGVPNGGAVLDRCNVCAGDGTSCLGCTTENVTSTNLFIDGKAFDQHALNKLIGHDLKAVDKKSKKFVKRLLEKSTEHYNDAWVTVWTGLPVEIQSCTNTELCVTVSNTEIQTRYAQDVTALKNIADQLANRLALVKNQTKRAKKHKKKANNLLNQSLQAIGTARTTDICN
jgi:hypothetical protein